MGSTGRATMIVNRFGLVWGSSWSAGSGQYVPAIHRVQISHLSDKNTKRLRNFLEEISEKLTKAPQWKVVYVNRRTGPYWRRAPGAVKLEKLGGAEAFKLFDGFVSIGIQVIEDW